MTGQQVLGLRKHLQETSGTPYIEQVWEVSDKPIFRVAVT